MYFVGYFWFFGFSVMYGHSAHGLFGTSMDVDGFFQSTNGVAFFLYQMMFCGTVATIVSGAVAERTKFTSYLFIVVLVSLLIYPVVGHWVWGGRLTESPGWLEAIGFIDYGGAAVVHVLAGWVSLAAVIIVGPRTGRFIDGRVTRFNSSSYPNAVLGVFLLWVGWIGFIGGNGHDETANVPLIVLNMMLSGVFATLSALCVYLCGANARICCHF